MHGNWQHFILESVGETVEKYIRSRLFYSAGMILNEKRCRLTDRNAECVMVKCQSKGNALTCLCFLSVLFASICMGNRFS